MEVGGGAPPQSDEQLPAHEEKAAMRRRKLPLQAAGQALKDASEPQVKRKRGRPAADSEPRQAAEVDQGPHAGEQAGSIPTRGRRKKPV